MAAATSRAVALCASRSLVSSRSRRALHAARVSSTRAAARRCPRVSLAAAALPPSTSPAPRSREIPAALAPAPGLRSPRRGVVARGLPIPIIGGLFTPPVFAVMYVFVAIRMWLNFDRTSYAASNKAMMVGLWPVLAVASASFRENFKKTMRS